MSGVTATAASTLTSYDDSTVRAYSAKVILPPNASAVMRAVSIACDTTVEPVARSHRARLPVAFFRTKKTLMSTTLATRKANIDEIWMRSALEKTRSNDAGSTPVQSGWVARGHHGM